MLLMPAGEKSSGADMRLERPVIQPRRSNEVRRRISRPCAASIGGLIASHKRRAHSIQTWFAVRIRYDVVAIMVEKEDANCG